MWAIDSAPYAEGVCPCDAYKTAKFCGDLLGVARPYRPQTWLAMVSDRIFVSGVAVIRPIIFTGT